MDERGRIAKPVMKELGDLAHAYADQDVSTSMSVPFSSSSRGSEAKDSI